jgi:hypothetical protein
MPQISTDDKPLRCQDCGRPIRLAQRWTGRWMCLDVEPYPPESKRGWLELAKGHFVPVFRHNCMKGE